MVDDQERAAWQSFTALAATMLFTSLRHIYRFGAPALLFNAVTIILAVLLLWQRRRASTVAYALYGIVAAWIVRSTAW